MSIVEIAQLVGGVAGIALLLWVLARAGSKPRSSPKVPRDRSQDTRVSFWFRLF